MRPSDEHRRDLGVALLLAESAALLIAILMPITPSRTGSDWSVGQLVSPEPSYLLEVLIWFVLTNVLIGIIGVAFLVTLRRRARSGD